MLDWHEFMDEEHQKDLLREAQRLHLIRGLRTARRKERSRFRGQSKKTLGMSEMKSRSI